MDYNIYTENMGRDLTETEQRLKAQSLLLTLLWQKRVLGWPVNFRIVKGSGVNRDFFRLHGKIAARIYDCMTYLDDNFKYEEIS